MKALLGPLFNRTSPPMAPSFSGLRMPWSQRNDDTAQLKSMGQIGTLFNVVSTTSQATAEVKWRLYRKAKSGNPADRTEVTSHPALDLFHTPNKFMTNPELVEVGQQHMDLTGETWLFVGRNDRFRSIPLELWPIRPDFMTPVPSATDYLQGYVYTTPDGGQMPLELDQILFMRMPDPTDPYRGMAPVQSVMTELDSARYSSEWNRNFFLNSAEPGGVIEVETRLSDAEWNEMVTRWREQHQGVANAHRIAVIEQGKWVPRTFTMRDMQFVELRNLSKEQIREAYGFPKFASGEVDDVNRATADASSTWFGRRLTVPRLKRWRAMWNNDFLPLFGATTKGLEFDFDSPVDDDAAAVNEERTSKATAAKTYIDAGAKPESVQKALDLPASLEWEEPEPAPAPPAPGQSPAGAVPAEQVVAMLQLALEARARDDAGSHDHGFRSEYWS